jgi:hypothetical protein
MPWMIKFLVPWPVGKAHLRQVECHANKQGTSQTVATLTKLNAPRESWNRTWLEEEKVVSGSLI